MSLTLPQPEELTRRILIRLWVDVPNAAFGLDQTFDPGIGRWAKVDPIHGLALRAGMQTAEVPTHLFWIRWLEGTKETQVTSSHVVEWAGRRYRVIDAIDAGDARLFVRITAKDLGAIA